MANKLQTQHTVMFEIDFFDGSLPWMDTLMIN